MTDPRRSHVQKTTQQRADYVKAVDADSTVKEPIIPNDSDTTSESLPAVPKPKTGQRRPVRFKTLLREFGEEYWVGILSVAGTALLGFLGWMGCELYAINRELGINSSKIGALEKSAERYDAGLLTLEGVRARLEYSKPNEVPGKATAGKTTPPSPDNAVPPGSNLGSGKSGVRLPVPGQSVGQ